MNRTTTTLLTLLLSLSLTALTMAPAATATNDGDDPTDPAPVTATITLRVAPEGFVIPSHWAVGNAAVWLIDPVQDTRFNDQDGVAGCHVTLTEADGTIDGGDVLDAATETGCISGWTFSVSACCGRFVTGVDGLAEIAYPAGWWQLQLDGVSSPVGIDAMALTDGQSLELVYVTLP